MNNNNDDDDGDDDDDEIALLCPAITSNERNASGCTVPGNGG